MIITIGFCLCELIDTQLHGAKRQSVQRFKPFLFPVCFVPDIAANAACFCTDLSFSH